MIEGLICTVSGTELRTLCGNRADHHRRRAVEYAEQAARFPDESESSASTASNSPFKQLKDKAAEHNDAAAKMEFIAAHVSIAESYQLGTRDLVTLGICKREY